MLEASTNEGNAMNDFEKVRMTRRGSLLRLGGLVATVAGGGALVEAETAGAGPAAVASGAVKCVLTPELTEGPYYIAGEKVRRDITKGKSGVPLFLKTTVVSASNCKPIKGAAVDVWHCDAGGVYSGFGSASSGQGGGPGFGGGGGGGGQQTPTDKLTFLRGIQYTDKNGLAVFKTIYPGWYQGRAVHIHVKVHVGGSVVHTGQLFFPDALTAKVYEAEPYSSRGAPDTSDAADSIYRNGGSKGLLSLTKQASGGYVGTILMGVHTT
jgi:protocatechuate 3,4-dioxygenase beta subunit